ncbi:MAG: glycosyltransferase [Terriglobia bacterium]
MALYALKPDTLEVQSSYERSLRVCLITDAASGEGAPAAVNAAVDGTLPFSSFQPDNVPQGFDAAFWWFAGESLACGSSAGIRRELVTPRSRAFVPVHYPLLPELDLIGLQPRIWTAPPRSDYVIQSFRILASASPSDEFLSSLSESGEPWARLCGALMDARHDPGAAIERLSSIWREPGLSSTFAGLALRNLALLLVFQKEFDRAEQVLESGIQLFPDYPELSFLMGWLRWKQGCWAEISRHINRAVESRGNVSLVGSGGETSYRAHWLMAVLNDAAGSQQGAFTFYRSGLAWKPAFGPAVIGILNQRLPASTVCRLAQGELCALARRERRYFAPVFYFLLLHRQFGHARKLLELVSPPEPQKSACEAHLETAASAFRPGPRPIAAKPGVILIGDQFSRASLARVNREVGAALLQRVELDVALEPHSFSTGRPSTFENHEILSRGLMRQVGCLDLTIRHHWPPDFRRPPRGKLVVLLPWEFGAISRQWVEQIENNVDELWTPSNFCRDVFIRSGVTPSRVVVIPSGIDTRVFTPEGPRLRPQGSRGFVFLMAGAAIPRKGADLLLEAYCQAFSPADDVTLVIKDFGSQTFYRHMSLLSEFRRAMDRASSPHIVVIDDEIADSEMANLYRGCDVFVLPYRGEGFGLPLAEGLACGKPVMTTARGPAREFCPAGASYFVAAREAELPQPQPGIGEMAGPCTWFEPDVRELAERMRYIYENRDEARERGLAASTEIHERLNWPRINSLYLERIKRLV